MTTYRANCTVSHRTPNGEVWLCEGHGVGVKSKNPESAWALLMLDRGASPDAPVQFKTNGKPSLSWSTLRACAAPALKARAHFRNLTTREAG